MVGDNHFGIFKGYFKGEIFKEWIIMEIILKEVIVNKKLAQAHGFKRLFSRLDTNVGRNYQYYLFIGAAIFVFV